MENYEDGLISTILTFPDEHAKIFSRIRPEYFREGSRNRKVYKVLSNLHDEFKPNTISNEAIIRELNSLLSNDGLGWEFWIKYFSDEVPPAVDVDFHMKRVITEYNRRRIREITNAVNKRIENGDSNESISAYTKFELENLETENLKGGPQCFYDIAADCIDQVQNVPDKTSLIGIQTGFLDLDRSIIGLRPTDFIIIAGRPSMGKTTLATNISMNAAKSGKVGLIFSLEMSAYRLGLRMIASDTSTNLYELSRGEVRDYSKINNISDGLNNLYVDFSTNLTAMDLQNRVREFTETKHIDFIMVDYLQKLRFTSKQRRDLEVGDAALLFKNLAKDYGLPVILLSQLSRANEKMGSDVRKPRLSDLRESGAIEEHADIVLFLHREEVYNPNEPKHLNKADLIIAKNRDGETGFVTLTFLKHLNRFENYTG